MDRKELSIADQLYEINSVLSTRTHIMKEPLTLDEMDAINVRLGQIIKQLRNKEK